MSNFVIKYADFCLLKLTNYQYALWSELWQSLTNHVDTAFQRGPYHCGLSIGWSVCWFIFRYLGDPLVFSNFLHEDEAPYWYKNDKVWFLKKNLGFTRENHVGDFLKFFTTYLCIFSKVSYVISLSLSNTWWKLHVLLLAL